MLRRLTRPFRHGALFAAFLLVRAFVALTPRRLVLAAARPLGYLAWLAGGRSRRRATSQLGDVLALAEGEAARTCREMYRHFALDFFDLMIFGGWRRRFLRRHVRVEGFEHIERALAGGAGVIGLTAHFCNWELLGGVVAARLGGIAVLAHPAYDKYFNRLLVSYRRRLGVRTIYRTEPVAAPLAWVRGGRFLGVLADQNIADMPCVAVDFMGRRARTPLGPALLARRAGAPIVPIFIVREPDLSYRVVVEPPLAKSAAPRVRDALAEDTAAWSAVVGRWVRKYPAQWGWVHERWRLEGEAEGR